MTDTTLQPYRPEFSPMRLPPPTSGLGHLVGEAMFLVCRHKWKILICLLLGIGAAGYIYHKTPVVFRSEARLLVRYIAERTMDDPAGLGGRVTSPDSRGANIIQSEIGILTSRDLVERVVDEIGPSDLLAHSEDIADVRSAAILSIGLNLNAQSAKNSNIIHVHYDASTPAQAQEVLGRITRLYLEKHVEVHRAGLAHDFLSQQTDQMAARLAETERDLQAARAEIGVGDIDVAKENNRSRIEDMSQQLFLADSRLASVQARLETLVRQSSDRDAATAGKQDEPPAQPPSLDPETSAMISMLTLRLRRLREREMSLLATYTENSPLVQSVKREIEKAEEEWRKMAGALPSQALASISTPGTASDVASLSARIGIASLDAMTELAALSAQRNVILQHLDDARRDAARIEAAEAMIRRLQRRRNIEEANYLYFSKNLEQARIDDALDSSKITNINVVQRATLPLKGFRPDLPKRMGIALAAGLFAGIGLAFLLENGIHSRKFVRVSDVVQSLALPVLVTIPKISRRSRRNRRTARFYSVDPKSIPWVSPAGFASYCEHLHHRIMLLCRVSRKPMVLGITGCSHDAGVSTIASGIAMSIARENDTHVLLTTASLQSGAEVFVNEQGLVTVMDWSRTVIDRPDATEILPDISSPVLRFQAFLSRIDTETHGCVVLDLPPVCEQARTLAFTSFLDGVVLVVKAENDRRAIARQCMELLNEAKVPVLGVVFNKFRQYVPKWLSNDA